MIYIFTFIFISLDFLTGVIKAITTKSYDSSAMRAGLFHKIGSVLCVVLATLIDYAQLYIQLGFNVNLTIAVCTYIIIMEIASIIENIGAINPDLVPDKIKSIFNKLK